MNAWQFARYVGSSGLTWAADFVVFMLLYKWAGVPIALAASRVIAGLVGFHSHKRLSFKAYHASTAREIFGYFGLASVNYLISVALMIWVPTGVAIAHMSAAKIAVELVIFAANYLFLRRLFLPR